MVQYNLAVAEVAKGVWLWEVREILPGPRAGKAFWPLRAAGGARSREAADRAGMQWIVIRRAKAQA